MSGIELEVLLRKVFGPYGLFRGIRKESMSLTECLQEILSGNISLTDIFKPLLSADMGGIEQQIKSVLEKVGNLSYKQIQIVGLVLDMP